MSQKGEVFTSVYCPDLTTNKGFKLSFIYENTKITLKMMVVSSSNVDNGSRSNSNIEMMKESRERERMQK